MVGRLRPWPMPSATIILIGLVGEIGAVERSVSGSLLQTGGGTDSVDAPLVIPRFPESEVTLRLDGKLDDAIWTRVPAYDKMTLISPDRGGTGRYRTQTFIFYTERGLYFGAFNEQPTDSLTPRLAGRDGWGTGDAYQVMIDSSGEGRYGYWFMVVLGGTLADGHLMPERRFSDNWDGPWQGETSEIDAGWTVEIFLPWSMIDMPNVGEGPRRMGLLVTRDLAAINERWAWPGLSWTQPKFISAFQPVEFEGIAPRQQFSVFPYVSHLSDIRRDHDEQKAGVDVIWRPSTSVLINAAFNPDFGQVDADDIIVNLSAYETFFPEKRLFFTENQEVFRGGVSNAPDLLHTRRIGSSVGSRRRGPDLQPGVFLDPFDLSKPVDLSFAAKGVGQVGKWRWGALGASEADTELALAGSRQPTSIDAIGRDFGVMRWQREATVDGGRRAIGWMGTVVDHPARRVFSHGIDAHYRTPDAVWTWDGQVFLSDAAGTLGTGGLAQLQLAPRRGDTHVFRVDHYGDELDLNDAGFLWRNDYGGLSYSFERRNQRSQRLRELRSGFSAFADFNGSGRRIGTAVNANWSWTLSDNRRFALGARYEPGHWDDRNSRGNGDYRVRSERGLFVNAYSDSSRAIATAFGVGAFTEPEGGLRRLASAGFTWRPIERITFAPNVSYTGRDAWVLWRREGTFDAFESEQWSMRLLFDAFFSARQQLRLQTEWTAIKAHGVEQLEIAANGKLAPGDASTRNFAISRMTVQLRYRWQIAPLSDLFVVYNRGGSLSGPVDRGFPGLFRDAFDETQREALLVKLRYRFGR